MPAERPPAVALPDDESSVSRLVKEAIGHVNSSPCETMMWDQASGRCSSLSHRKIANTKSNSLAKPITAWSAAT